jgi:hypothetical protein
MNICTTCGDKKAAIDRKMRLAPGLHGALFFKHKKKNQILSFKKNKKYLDVANCIRYETYFFYFIIISPAV